MPDEKKPDARVIALFCGMLYGAMTDPVHAIPDADLRERIAKELSRLDVLGLTREMWAGLEPGVRHKAAANLERALSGSTEWLEVPKH